ncbi:hypothetical protein F2Q69_00029337 [Brassica cretica]|uniref:Uncharacterized protein n=1 Tax=Brassica cretica TaxID=69181 RepID=A0A8S9RTR5_BRACR|nr:hypothetical protein F2Q69_00029337 [Brassica cretica]
MFCEAREKMRMRITLKKKSDPGQFAIPCTLKGIEFPHSLCDTRTSVSILPRVMADHLGLQVEPSQELFTFVDCSQRNSGRIVRDLEVQIGNALVPVDFHVLDIKLNWNFSLLLGRAFLSTVGAVCNLQTNHLCLTLIDPNTHYDHIPVKKPQMSSRRINDPGIIAACHCGAEYETEYSASIETYTATSIDSGHQKSIDIPHEESVDSQYRKKGIVVHKFCPLGPEIQAQVETDSLLAEAYGKGTSSSRISEADRRPAIDREIHESIDRAKKKPFDVNMPPSIDRHPEFGRRAFDLFRARKFHWEDNDEYGIYRDDQGCARDMDGHIINVSKEEIKRLMERASRDEPSYICLPEHVNLFTQTKLVPEIYTKDEINEMFYGVCREQENNKEAFQMKLDGVYYPLNDSISWLTTCMEEMKQDIARIQHANDVARSSSINRDQHTSINIRPRTSIDNQMPTSVDNDPPCPHTMKSQQNFHTREEIDQLVEEIYKALETTEERLDGRCDDIYFPMDLSISALTSKIETMQGELVEIQSYISRRPEASSSIDRGNNKSTDIHY